MKRIAIALLVLFVLGACAPAPAPTAAPAGPDLAATVAALETLLASEPVVIEIVTPFPPVATATATPEPTAPPEYRVIECGERPANGTLIQILKPTTSRACSDSRCENQGTVVVGSVRPLEAWDWDEGTGDKWLRFSYLPLEGKDYNLLEWEKYDGEWQWRLVYQWVRGTEGDEFQCVEPWAE